MDVPILYEDADVVVINKPAGLIVHSDGRNEESSVADWVLARHPETRDVGEPLYINQGKISSKYDELLTSSTIERPGIVHRLDRGTSGVMVIARNSVAYEHLKKQFKDRTTEKKYRAFVYGHPAKDSGIIEAEIVRLRSVPPRWGVARAEESRKHRAAITEWRVIERSTDSATGEDVSYIEASPKTGRTHQIRVHMKYLNHPVVCDPLYAKGRPCLFSFSRPALHAFSLTISLPSGETRTFTAPLPEDFTTALAHLGIGEEEAAAKRFAGK